jgi:hypothetical protein
MKRILSTIVPLFGALGACSSNAPSSAQSGDGGPDTGTLSSGDDGSVVAMGDDGATPATEYNAKLSGAEVVPAVLTSSSGTAKFFLQPDGVTLKYQIKLSVPNASAVAVHIAAPAENGAVTHPLTPVSASMSGSITLTMDEQAALTADQLYVDVKTAANPAGEVRGQLLLPGAQIFVAAPSGAQQLPPVMSMFHGHASFVLSPDQGTILYHVVTDATPTDVRLHRAIGAVNGPVAYPLGPVGQTIDATVQIGANDSADLIGGRFYLNIVTADQPAGELRGQVIRPGETLFTGVLSGQNEVPPVASQATGGTQFVLSAAQDSLRYEAIVNGVLPTGAEVDNAPAKSNGPTLGQLMLAPEGALGNMPMPARATPQFFGGATYVNIRTLSYASGELRAQLVAAPPAPASGP